MQKDEIDKWAKENNCIIHDYYIDDGYTATNMKRPELLRMLDEAEYFDLIVFIKLDRFVRKVPHYYKIMERLEETKTAWKTIFEEYDTTTQDGQFMINIYLSMAQKEAALASERTKAVFKNRIENGECIISNLPRGYRREKINGKGTMVIDPEKALEVREIFRHYRQFGSLRLTLKYAVNEKGIAITINALKRVLTNTAYIGVYTHKELGEFPGFCPPIISKKEFYEVQELLKRNAKHSLSCTKKYDYIFAGMLRCNVCGNRLSGKKPGKKRPVYLCVKATRQHLCTNRHNMSEKRIEEFLVANVRELLSNKVITYKIEKGKAAQSPVIKMKKRIKKLEDRMDELTDLKIAGTIRAAKYEKDFRTLEAELLELEAEVKKTEIKEETFDLSIYESFLEQDFESIYATLSYIEKRRLWLSIIDRIEIEKGIIIPIFF